MIQRTTIALLIAIACALSGANATAKAVDTTSGTVRGSAENGVIAFKGIPFAQDTSGRQRWTPPKPVKRARQEIDASNYGPACPQPEGSGQDVGPTSEDCLNLNVWTPGIDDRARPVMVWIHGGGFRFGSNQIPGEVLARQNVVVVSINYRLGPLGFLAHPALKNKEANVGLMDMVAGLQWVRDNISSFGGSPHKITIFGVSAGGMAVDLLMVNDAAQGLFHRAIAQSGYATWALPRSQHAPEPAPLGMDLGSADNAEAIAQQIVARVTDKKQSRRTLQRLDAQALVEAVDGFHVPIVDGTTLREEPAILFDRGEQADVPFMTGGNSFEGAVMPRSGFSEARFSEILGEDLATLRNAYADDFAVSESFGLQRVFGDNRYLLASRRLGAAMSRKKSSAYLYYIDLAENQRQPGWPGTPHGYDAYILFGGGQDENPAIRNLSTRMGSYWVEFARTGRPKVEGLEQWFAYRPASDHWLVLSDKDELRSGIIAERLDVLEQRHDRRISPAK